MLKSRQNWKYPKIRFILNQRQFPEFAAAVETGRLAVAADKMEGNLMNMALGRCFSTTVRRSASGRETKTTRQLVPNLKMLIRWLERNSQYADDDDIPTSEPVKINIAVNSKYDESFLEDAERYAAEGYTDLQSSRRLGIALSSFYNYKKQFPAFAAALDSGKRECYSRLRCQLLALALGQCTVRTETYRDGDFRRSTERQLSPNLKAIKYWLQSGDAETASAQGHSKVSELPEDDGKTGRTEKTGKTGGVTGKSIETSTQRHSKVSESGGCPACSAGAGQNSSAQRYSKVSESGGCPPVASGFDSRMDETAYAQRHSKVSESGGCPPVASGFDSRMDETAYAQRHSKVSELDSTAPQTSQYADKAFAQRLSKMSRKERQRLLKNRRETRSLRD